jgi:hypothetical protein
MPAAGPAFSRRTLLLTAAAGTVLVACGGRRTASPSAGTADTAALQQAVDEERRLLAGYDGLLSRAGPDPTLEQARADHARHHEALLASLQTSAPVPSSPTVFPHPPTADDLGAAERASVVTLQSAAVAARDGTNAAVLASVAASHAARASGTRR